MPRIGLKALLATLKDAGVSRYVNERGRTELEFFAPGAQPGVDAEDALDPETRRDMRPPEPPKDPLRAALSDDPFPLGEDSEVEAN
jgi:hypothetical protein